MSMGSGLDLHRGQITFDTVNTDSEEVWRGRIWQPDRQRFRHWLDEELALRAGARAVALAVEGCTGCSWPVGQMTCR
jgi:hypothetical protein